MFVRGSFLRRSIIVRDREAISNSVQTDIVVGNFTPRFVGGRTLAGIFVRSITGRNFRVDGGRTVC